MTEHDAVETVVVVELVKDLELEPVPVEFDHGVEVIGWAIDPQVRLAQVASIVLRVSPSTKLARL